MSHAHGNLLGDPPATLLPATPEADEELAAEGLALDPNKASSVSKLPDAVTGPFATAMAQSLLLAPIILVAGLAAAVMFDRPRHQQTAADARAASVAEDPVAPAQL